MTNIISRKDGADYFCPIKSINTLMKNLFRSLAAVAILTLVACGGKEEKKEDNSLKIGQSPATEAAVEKTSAESDVPASQRVDLTNKGVGPVKGPISLGAEIDEAMAAKGADVFKANCTACHRPDKKFIGPAPKGILERRTPEWIMNMIMDPEGMVKNDPLAGDLLREFNGSPMANQGINEEQARQLVEYFRTL